MVQETVASSDRQVIAGGNRKEVGTSAAASPLPEETGRGLPATGAALPRPPEPPAGFVLVPVLNVALGLTLKRQPLAADFDFIKDTATY